MSVNAVVVWEQGLLVAADGVCSDGRTGQVRGYTSKIITYPERNAIIAWTGIGTFGHHLNTAIAQKYPTFDDLLDFFPEVCRRVHDEIILFEGWQHQEDHATSIVIGGYSALRKRFEAYRLASYGKESTNGLTGEKSQLVPWRLQPIEWIFCSHNPKSHLREEFGLNADKSVDDLVGYCIRLVCANRAESGLIEDEAIIGARFFNVGGFVQMAFMEQDHLRTWIAHRWPEDVIGEGVDPSRGAKLPAYLLDQDDAARTA